MKDILLKEVINSNKYILLVLRKRDEKHNEKRSGRDTKTKRKRSRSSSSSRSRSYSSKSSYEEKKKGATHTPKVVEKVPSNIVVKNEVAEVGDFSNFPEIHPKTIESLKKRGINALFPVQFETFYSVWDKKDMIIRDLTGSGKTLAFALPIVENLRKSKDLGKGKI